MYLFLLVGNPIYCRLYCQRMMHPNPWVITEQRWWTSDKLVITLWNCFWRPTCSGASAVKLPCCLNSEQKKNWKEWIWKNSIGLFDKRCVYIRMCVCTSWFLSCSCGTAAHLSSTSFLLSCKLPDSCPLTVFDDGGVGGQGWGFWSCRTSPFPLNLNCCIYYQGISNLTEDCKMLLYPNMLTNKKNQIIYFIIIYYN